MEKIALFDFCETIADFQTLDPYLELVLSRERPHIHDRLCRKSTKKFLGLFTRALYILGIERCVYKELLIRQLRGLTRNQLENYGHEYYDTRIKDHLIAPTIDLICQFKEENCRVFIVSAGSDLYIKYFAEEYGIEETIAAKIGFDGDTCTGRLVDDCMGERKAERIKEAFGELAEKPFLIGVTDSRSDLPMLEQCDRKIVISRGGHKSWVTGDIEEILWE